jgi:alpha-tubulin suppressor-like RCC1 family protein
VVGTGFSHSAAIRSDGRIFTWGAGANGRLGDGTTISRSSPVQVGTGSWTALSLGENHSSALDTSYKLWTWGSNAQGQLGDGTSTNRSSPVQVGSSSWTAVSAGRSHTVGIDSNNFAFGWGSNSGGQLGLAYSWTALSVGKNVIGSNIGNNFTLAISSDNTLWAWGQNNSGQLGLSDQTWRSRPAQVSTSSWTAVATGVDHALAIRSDGGLFAWGNNDEGQLGLGDRTSRSSPVQIGTSSWTSVSAGNSYSAAIRSDGALFTFGRNGTTVSPLGMLGDGTTIWRSSPVQVGTSSWTLVSCGYDTCYAIKSGATLWSWGSNGNGALGANLSAGTTPYVASPVQVGTSSWTAVAGGGGFGIGLRTDGRVFTWGFNYSADNPDYRLGLGDSLRSRSSPVQIGTSSYVAITAGVRNGGVLDPNRAYWSWGSGDNGVNAGTGRLSIPTLLNTQSWVILEYGGDNGGGVLYDNSKNGLLFMWGPMEGGQIGNNTNTAVGPESLRVVAGITSVTPINQLGNYSSPVQVGTSSWLALSAGNTYTLGILSNNRLFAWGQNSTGQLGDGTTTAQSSPVQISSSSWTAISAGKGTSSYGLNTNYNLYAWGLNSSGQLGDSTGTNRSSPVQIGTSSWNMVSGGGNFGAGLL